MSSLSSVHPPYAMPLALATSDTSRPAFGAFAAPALRRLPYVPPDARVLAATAVIDAPDEAALVSGARLDTPMHVPVVAMEPEQLPSIEQFLLESPVDAGAATMAALFATPDAELEPLTASRDADVEPDSDVIEATAHVDPPLPEHAADATGDEPWAIADATEAVAELADGLAGRAGVAETSGADLASEPLEPWTDDERWMDIMPALQTPGGPDLAGETAWARAFAEPPAPLAPAPLPAGDTEAAAASLEAIARRLRAGDLDIPGYRGERGDAAALAAALAALLGAGR